MYYIKTCFNSFLFCSEVDQDRCPGQINTSCLASRNPHECPGHGEHVYIKALDVDQHFMVSITATRPQDEDIITQVNPSRGTVLNLTW